jgi:hypothetical protein
MKHTNELVSIELAAATVSGACASRSDHRVGAETGSMTSRVEAYWKRREAKDLAGGAR